ncbi:type I polyketide synthase [Amycolatopsis sp. DSM 110486]|uniref:type I polyketide synthase n=2 Tax=unclassified Amycolatopsis TaxID=2618356 RepID=UPI00351CD126
MMSTSATEVVDALRASLVENERLRRQNQRLASAAAEPVAIVGIACRFPGGVHGPEELWRLVADGRDAMTAFPADRGWDGFDVPTAREAAFLTEAGEFDAPFFGISPREALTMDPQQRLLLEAAWEAVEHAGVDPVSLRGSRAGVFVGGASQEYGALLAESGQAPGYALTGVPGSVMSGRIAYCLGLEGPAVTVDTACSSSLVALHLATRSLRSGECDLALAGGVLVMSTPAIFAEFAGQGGSAGNGRCKPFADAADGTGWGEGVGLLAVMRLSDARRRGLRVLATVRGTAVNSDGASNGLTAPSGPSQQRVIRAALADAGLSLSDVDAVEAHGTGTRLGDPIEAHALLATYGQDRSGDRPLWIGSIKSNIGHTQYAAGVAGVIKMVMALRHRVLPRTLHVDRPTSQVDWTAGAVELLGENRPWPDPGRVRRAGVSSFGISGTNAHVVLEQAEPFEPTEPSAAEPAQIPLPPVLVSARGSDALGEQAAQLATWLSRTPDADPGDVARAMAAGRASLEERAAVVAGDRAGVLAGLRALAGGEVVPGVVRDRVREGRLAFSFAGQGAQRPGMARSLYEAFPVFAAAFDEICAAFAPGLDRPLADVVFAVEGTDAAAALGTTTYTQPALFAVEVALYRLLESWGVRPDVVLGHSIGELAAAHVAGLWTLADACAVVLARARLMGELPAGGAMVAVGLPEEQVRAVLAEHGDQVGVAAVNGPASVVVSGVEPAVLEVAAQFAAQGARTRRLAVSHAFHSPLMAPMLDAFRAVLERVTFGVPQLPAVSGLTGALVTAEQWRDPGYWVRHVRETVRFADGVGTLVDRGVATILELGPGSAGTAMAEECLAFRETEPDAVVCAAGMRGDRGEVDALYAAVTRAYVRGAALDREAFTGGRPRSAVELPTYAFRHRRYWLDGEPGSRTPNPPADAEFWAAVEQAEPVRFADLLGSDAAVWEPVLPALARWHRDRDRHALLGSWRYRTDWSPVPVASARALGDWLVMLPEGEDEFAARVTGALREHGATVRTVSATSAEDLAARLSGALDGFTPAGVLSLLGLAEGADPEFPALSSGLSTTVSLFGTLAGVDAPLWILTRSAVAVGRTDEVVSPAQRQLWGLGQVAGLELPRSWGGLVDLPADPDERVLDRLAGVLTATGGEDQVAIRAAGVFGRRLVRAAGGPGRGRGGWRPRGTVLVTGGTGGLGAQVARWLVANGAERLVLASRRGPAAAGAGELRAELSAAGAEVVIEACDVADREAVTALLARVPDEQPLRAVVHAAGIAEYRDLLSSSAADFAVAAGAKAAGARHLHDLTAQLDLDAFVLFSSGAAAWGGAGQAAYASANAYLDGLAEHRRARGLTATSIAWGPWRAGGMAADVDDEALLRRGLRAMDPEPALAALGEAVGSGAATCTIAAIDWARFTPAYTMARRRPLIEGVPEVVGILSAEEEPAGTEAGDELRTRLAAMAEAEQRMSLLELVRRAAAEVLGLPGPTSIGAGTAFGSQGFDSLTAMELRTRLGTATGLTLPAALVFDFPTPAELADALRERLLGVTTAREAAVARAVADEPVAVVGMGCRLPGGVSSPEDLWRLVSDGVDAVSGFPADRGWEAWPGSAGGRGGFLAEVGGFDAGFFGVSPREALAMDPQQRLLLEVSWEAVERAGIDPLSLHGSRTGVYVGGTVQEYSTVLVNSAESDSGYVLTGAAGSVLSGRLSYFLGLQGPAVSVDTACSSSLVGLHLAAQALRGGECDLALAGGVAVMSTPGNFVEFSRQGGLAADGRCKAFSSAADGTGWAEGVGVLVLERLSDARRNGHRVLAVVRGSAVNQDGASNGLTAPNGPSQERVIRDALAAAGLEPSEVDAVEGHGTGTKLGDPIEVEALLATYGRDRLGGEPLWLGSLKSNLGHTQAAAGVAGVIKAVAALRHGRLPATLHVDAPSGEVDWSSGAVELLTEAREWPATGRPRRVGVSSFGMSGTNAHVVLEQALEEEPVVSEPSDGVVLVPLSGVTDAALAGQAGRLSAHLASHPDVSEVAVAHTLSVGRSRFEHRAVVIGDRTSMPAGLSAVAEGAESPDVVRGTVSGSGGVAGIFAGQGGQWVGMGRALWEASPVFAESMAACERALAPWVDWSLSDVLDDPVAMGRVSVVQPVSWAVATSLAALWADVGVVPAVVVGHSQGEIAAACVAGALSLDDAARVVAVRSGLIERSLSGLGTMGSIAWPAERVEEAISTLGLAGVGVAAVNSPAAVIVSGPVGELETLVAHCAAKGARARRIPVDYASHSAQVDTIADELRTALKGITPQTSVIPMVSSVTGQRIDTTTLDADYWVQNLRSTVRFADAITAVAESGFSRFLEISAHPVLSAAVEDTTYESGAPATVLTTLTRDNGDHRQWLTAVATAYVKGIDLTLPQPTPRPAYLLELPTYPFQHQHFWLTPRTTAAGGAADDAFWSAVEKHDVPAFAEVLGGDPPAEFWGQALPVLAQWHEGRRRSERLDAWRYRLTWKRQTGDRPARPSGTWLVVAPAAEQSTVDALLAEGLDGFVVPAEAEATRERIAEDITDALARHGNQAGDLTGVLCLTPLDERPLTRHPVVPAGLAGTVAVTQALGALEIEVPVWLFTRGAVAVDDAEPVSAGQRESWGLGQVHGLENPRSWGGLVDLPAAPDEHTARRVLGVLTSGEDQVAVRASGVWARRLVRGAGGPGTWTPRGTVLVTGGTGGVGSHLTRWLVANGADRVVLVSRRGADAVSEPDSVGSVVSVVRCDVADRDALAEVVAGLSDELTAVVHAAGVASYGPTAGLTPDDLAEATLGKVAGARNLDELTADLDLDAFVLFSSGSAVWGSAGNGAYAAGNAFLDGLAEQRRARGLPATAIAWGAWGSGGMLQDNEGAAEALTRLGLRMMDPELAVAAMAEAVASGETALTVSDMDWARFTPAYTMARRRPLIEDIPEVAAVLREQAETTADTSTGDELRERLAGLLEAERHAVLLGLVRKHLAAVLRYDSPDAIADDRALAELGFDSLTAVELRTRLGAETGLVLPATLVFDHPTPAALARFVLARLVPAEQSLTDFVDVARELNRIAGALPGLGAARDDVARRLRELLAALDGPGEDPDADVDLDTASDDEIFDFIDHDLGVS